MSTKKQHLYNMAWWQLCECHQKNGGRTTAGEFAKKMGIARSTAKRWLVEMMSEGGCKTVLFTGKNGLLATAWIPVGYDVFLQQHRYIEQGE